MENLDAFPAWSISAETIESELTAPGKVTADNPMIKYPSAIYHDKWPGVSKHPREKKEGNGINYSQTGLRGDPYLARYRASLTTVRLKRLERQSLGQNALQGLLHQTGKAFLIGEGTGGNMAWLATDVEPDLVAGVIAIEPVGPPFGKATRRQNGHKIFTQSMRRAEGLRIYGLTDLPLTFDPPVNFHSGFEDGYEEPFEVEERLRPDEKGSCYLQRNLWQDEVIFNHETGEYEMSDRVQVRELYHLKKVPQAVVTGHASSHVMYDWATVSFMVQAGVPVQWIKLDEHQIFGNGHLMFLETNSDDIARLLTQWILNVTPEIFRGTLQDIVVSPISGQVGESSEEAVEEATARLQEVDMEDAEHAHSNDQLPVARDDHVESAQHEHAEPVHRNDQLPVSQANQVESAQTEHVEPVHQNHQLLSSQPDHVNSVQPEQALPVHHNDQLHSTQANRVGSTQPGQALHVHHNNQLLTAQTDFVHSVQSEHAESTHHNNNQSRETQPNHILPTLLEHFEYPWYDDGSFDFGETYEDFIQSEHTEAHADSAAQVEDTEIPDRDEESPDLEDYRDFLVLSDDEESPRSDHSSVADEDQVDLVPTGYPGTPHNSAQNSSDHSYEPSSGSDPSGSSSGSHDSGGSSGSHHDDDSPGAPQGNHSSGSHQDNQPPGSEGNVDNPDQSQHHTSDISYINSSPSQSDDEIVLYQRAVTPQNQTLSSLGPSQASSSSVHEQSTTKRPPPSSSDPGSSPPATSWGPKRPRVTTSPPAAATYTPSVANATPSSSQYTGDTSRWDRDQSIESPIMSLATLRPANPAGPARSRPRIVTTLSSPNYASSPPLGYSSDRDSQQAYGLAEPSPVQGQLHSSARDSRRYSPLAQSTPGGSDHGGSTHGYTTQGYTPQGYTTQGNSAQGYQTQGQSTQGYRTQGYSTESPSTQGHSTQGYATQGYQAQGYQAQGQSIQGYHTQGYSASGPSTESTSTHGYSAQGYTTQNYSTQGPSTDSTSTQRHSTQGYTTQGYQMQDQSIQGYHTQGYSTSGPSTESPSTHGYSAQGYTTQNYSAQGDSAHGPTTQGSTTCGQSTQIYPHSAARFACQPGTAEESIAAMARPNQARLTINTSHSTTANEELQYSPFTQPRILPGSQMNQGNGTNNNTGEASQVTTPAPIAQSNPARPSTPEAPDSEVENDWFSMFGCPPRATPPSPSPAPRGSSNPASSSASRGSPVRSKSLKRHASK
ncbi:hypothetical protein CEP52_015712 [Fusarium oligoseptatum]|uniref:AB hydrolase-1 domain-containing protein n=1 Tax=Fusarium oligoseptatum TaxID=2604345 RepID=A0A428SAH4_9HYPO|nr:hypothetical protein CEP52_015712 [Fusarium oligoseptatum]